MFNICPKVVINLSAIRKNYINMRDFVGEKTICSAVVKNDAYGLGSRKVVVALYEAGCRDFWVAYISEAIDIRCVLPLDANIYFLQGFDKSYIGIIKAYSIVPVINSIEEFNSVINNNLKIVLHVDTGLTRLGLRENDIDSIIKEIANEEISYVISHLACADECAHPLNKTQKENFDRIFLKIKACNKNVRASISASSGVFVNSDMYKYDMVRCGAYLYGIHFNDHKSENVMSLKTSVLQKYNVPFETFVGYGSTYITKKNNTTIAVISIGYADGIKRSLSNRGCVMFYEDQESDKQYRANILGTISMDLLVCDVTDIPDNLTDIHRTAYILDDNYTINEMAKDASTIPYEILTSINFKSKRFDVQYLYD